MTYWMNERASSWSALSLAASQRRRSWILSGAIVLFMKAFEHELHRALGQLRSDLDEVFSQDLAEMHTTLDRLTLGNWERLLKNHSSVLTSCFQAQGFSLHDIRDAIMKVNDEVMAKHPDEKGLSVATRFRDLFLGPKPSVLAALFPPGQTTAWESRNIRRQARVAHTLSFVQAPISKGDINRSRVSHRPAGVLAAYCVARNCSTCLLLF